MSNACMRTRLIDSDVAAELLSAAIKAEECLCDDIEAANWEDDSTDTRYPLLEQLRSATRSPDDDPQTTAQDLLTAIVEAEHQLTQDIEAANWEDDASDTRYPLRERLRASIARATV